MIETVSISATSGFGTAIPEKELGERVLIIQTYFAGCEIPLVPFEDLIIKIDAVRQSS